MVKTFIVLLLVIALVSLFYNIVIADQIFLPITPRNDNIIIVTSTLTPFEPNNTATPTVTFTATPTAVPTRTIFPLP